LFGISKWETLKNVYFSMDTRKVHRVSSQTWITMIDGPSEEPVLSRIKDRQVYN